MTADELWNEFISKNNVTDCEYDAWAFGDKADILADLVRKGEKTTTTSSA